MHIVRYLVENEADIGIQERIGVSICDSGTNKKLHLTHSQARTKDLLAMDLSFSRFVTLTFPDVESIMSLEARKVNRSAVAGNRNQDAWLVQPVHALPLSYDHRTNTSPHNPTLQLL